MKPNILLLNGWGSTCNVWESIIPALEERYQINCISPPWMPNNVLATSIGDFDLYIAALAKSIKHATHVIAWSLGGLIAIRLATRFPTLINKIIFIASTTRFVHQEVAIDPAWFKQFKRDYDSQPKATITKFLTLQTTGDEFAKATLRQLREFSCIDAYDLIECGYSLAMLEKLDLTTELTQMSCSCAFIHGECDAVLPVRAGRRTAGLCNANFYSIPAAGHVPHVSHSQEVVSLIMNYLD